MDERIQSLMAQMEDKDASDLHVTAGTPPQFRRFGELTPADMPKLTNEDTEEMIHSLLNEEQLKVLEQDKELDCSVSLPGEGRFRLNVFYQRGAVGAALRRLPYNIPAFEDLGLPPGVMKKLSEKNSGLILVTGPTGSGKSTTMAAAIDHVNRHFHKHIICVEDPIEYLHSHKSSIVNQREVGDDTHRFADALKHVLRQDPDVVQIGEMRDLETIQTVLTVAETGHLAFSTLHTNSAVTTVNRVIDVFPSDQQEQVRVQLSFVLQAVIAQQLLPTANGNGRALACEILVMTPAMRNLIREAQVDQLYSHLQMGKGEGMRTMNQSLADLVLSGKVSESEARYASPDLKELNRLLKEGVPTGVM
jgi:twitching motility protein PilT